MKYILYYSNNCNNSKNVLYSLARNYKNNDVCYICIDKRIINKDGTKSVILDNGQHVPLPPNITHVPSLILLNNGFNVIHGDVNILNELSPKSQQTVSSLSGFVNNEPIAFSMSEMHGMSDNYSYFDLDPHEMSAQGNGGLTMMHGFARIDHIDNIQTPPDDEDNKTMDLEKVKRDRDNQIQINKR